MGVVRLLCITIAFAFLATVAAQDCNSNGARVNGRCVCTSGFAGALCETQNPGTCFGSINTPKNLQDNWFPNLVKEPKGFARYTGDFAISFTNNVLKLNINGELVSQRVYTDITFINNLSPSTLVTDSRCMLSGGNSSFWTQSNQATDSSALTDGQGNTGHAYVCGDLFGLAMPWDQHTYCGFSLNSAAEITGDVHLYEAMIKMSYDDQLDVFDPQNPTPENPEDNIRGPMTRHASVSYTIHVQFTKIINVQVQQIVVYSQVNLTVVLTQFEYDPSTSAATMTFASIVRYPHVAVRNFTTIEIPHNPALSFGVGSGIKDTVSSYVVFPETDQSIRLAANDICDDIPTDYNLPPRCLQYFTTKVYLGTGSCNFDGTYIFGTLVSTCRDAATYRSCPSEIQFVGLKLSNSGVCGAVTAEPQVTGELVAYKASGMADADRTNEYLVGSRAFFAVKINTRNSFHLKWLDIFTISTDDTNIWDMNDKIPAVNNLTYVRPAHAQYFVKDARLQYNNFFTQTHPNSDASFDPAKYPNGPVDIQGWQNEVTVNGHLTDGAVVMGPNFNFRWDGGIFTPGINKKKVYNVIAKAQLTFEGNEAENRKREVKIVDFVYKSDTSALSANILCGLMAEETVAPAPASEAVTSSSVNMVAIKAAVPVAGVALVVVAVAVIAAVVIVRRKKNTSAFRTMA